MYFFNFKELSVSIKKPFGKKHFFKSEDTGNILKLCFKKKFSIILIATLSPTDTISFKSNWAFLLKSFFKILGLWIFPAIIK